MSFAAPSILVVDDEVDTCLNLADIFSDMGYRVDVAHDGATALEMVRQQRYDVALLDLMMPGMDGAELYEQIKQLRAGIVAIIVTAHPGNPRADAALTAGAWRLLPKPVDFQRVMGLIEEAVGQPLIMVVDDDTDLCCNLWDLLRDRGYRVCLAHTTERAIERVKDDAYRVILLDMRLPDGDGSMVLEKAQQSDPNTQVIVITGHFGQLEPRVQRVLTEGASAVLQKPFNVPALLEAVRQMTGKELAKQCQGA